jgi:hypothetical protein
LRSILDLIVSSMAEIEKRSWTIESFQYGAERWVKRSFAPVGVEDAVPAAEFSGCLWIGLRWVAVGAVVGLVVAVPIIVLIRNNDWEKEKRAILLQFQQQIHTREGTYPGLPPDLGRNWRPGDRKPPEDLVDLSVTPPTGAGTGKLDPDDKVIDDLKAQIPAKPDPAKKTADLSTGTGEPGQDDQVVGDLKAIIPAKPSPAFDERSLQAIRVAAIGQGDMEKYRRLIEEHKALYRQHGVDPCKSPFFPQGCERGSE